MMKHQAVAHLLALCLLGSVACKQSHQDHPGSGGDGNGSAGTATMPGSAGQPDGSNGGASSGAGGTSSAAGMSGVAGNPVSADCGNGDVDEGEECDDGNRSSGDGCSYRCEKSCEACEQATCATDTPFKAHPWYSYAYTMEGDAEAGPAKGQPRAELVKNVLECIYQSQCTLVFNDDPAITAQISLRNCFCTNAPADAQPDNYPDICKNDETRKNGPCLDQMLAAAESDTVDKMLTKLSTLSVPLGRAFMLLQHCDARVCGRECLPDETGL